MKITLTLDPFDAEDEDADHPMGITNDAYERLEAALQEAGFAIADGPDAVREQAP